MAKQTEEVEKAVAADKETRALGPQPPPPNDDEFLVIYLPEWESAYEHVNKKAKG